MKMFEYFCVVIFSLAFTSIASEGVSPDGYHQLLGLSYYKVHGELAPSWDQARQVCVEEGAHLAVLNSEEEARVLSAMFAAANVSAGGAHQGVAYMGFHDMYTEGDFITIFDQPLSSTGYTQWSPGEPNSGTIENCGAFDTNGKLHDIRCSLYQAFICERVEEDDAAA